MLSEGNTVCSWSPRVGHFLIAGLNFVSRCPMVLFVGKHHQESLPRETPKSPKLVWSSVDVAPRLESPPGSRKRTENYGSGWAAELHCRAAGCSNISVSNNHGKERADTLDMVWLDQPPGFVTIGPLDSKLHFLEIQCDDELWCRHVMTALINSSEVYHGLADHIWLNLILWSSSIGCSIRFKSTGDPAQAAQGSWPLT